MKELMNFTFLEKAVRFNRSHQNCGEFFFTGCLFLLALIRLFYGKPRLLVEGSEKLLCYSGFNKSYFEFCYYRRIQNLVNYLLFYKGAFLRKQLTALGANLLYYFGLFLCPSENIRKPRFCDFFRWYRKRPVA